MMETGCLWESDGLTFWLARPEDYDDVMGISQDIYWGYDYLPYRYHIWMTEPDRVVIVARKQGRLVALDSGLVVDGGQTVVLEGLRVCPKERGCGMAGAIQRFTDRYIRQLYPNVRTKRLTRGDDPGPVKLSKFTLLARRGILSLCGETESFDDFVSGLKAKLQSEEGTDGVSTVKPKPMLVSLREHQLKTLILDPDLPSRLQLPGGAFIQDWQPLQPIESNLEVLGRRNPTWLADGSNEKPIFVSSHLPPYPVPLNGGALRFNIDLFGTDPTFAKNALVGHLERARKEIQGLVVVHVYMHQSLWQGMRQFCEGHAGVKQCKDYWEQLFLEVRI